MKINSFVPDTKVFDVFDENKNKINNTESKNEGKSFLDTLKSKLDEVNDQQIAADNATQSYIKGDDIDIHQVMLSQEEAKMSLELAVQVRNKIVEAYQELNRMQL